MLKAFSLLAIVQKYEKYLIFKNTQWNHNFAAGSKRAQYNAVYLKCYLVLFVTQRHFYKALLMFSEGFAAVTLRIGNARPIYPLYTNAQALTLIRQFQSKWK